MKFLKSPIAVTVLAIVATVLIFKSAVLPLIQRSGWGMRKPSPAVLRMVESARSAAQLVAQRPTLESATKSLLKPGKPLPPLDLTAISVSSVRWMDSPRRDPFKIRAQGTNSQSYPSAMQLLTLKGIWHQTGSSLAVINDHVLGKGDGILAFRIETIETDRVWVQGPNGREAVEFKVSVEPLPETPTVEGASGEPKVRVAGPQVAK